MSSDEADRDDIKMDDDDRDPIAIRSIVTGPEAGSIIGRKGETVKNIRAESQAQVNIEGDSQLERIITVRGKTDSIFKAYTMICKVLEQREKREDKEKSRNRSGTPDPDELNLKVLVPAVQVGALIGKGGEKIKEIRAETGADINISSDPLPGSSEREMKIRGKREQITKCIFHICSILMEHPPKVDVRLYKPESRDHQRDRDRGGGDPKTIKS
ncbi:poly(rC)-binding protein 3 [Eurytemora carolleeae]|uniref:poly(rC)-binding protein 3 n=1 Tax=Eurytemora carolleeae TaxID=1294199 RepID=UPI000C77F5A2|nr:poly(rC)-binding protein 3 [Eurytemora carolleeae]|eukprot:XP_023326294.1 poly(rC)-binding protein 3-like [Eurytemora affinis]